MPPRRKRRVAWRSPSAAIWAMTGAMARDQRTTNLPSMTGERGVRYLGGRAEAWSDTYHHLLTMPLAAFFAVMGGVYLAINAVFGLIYFFVGGIDHMRPGNFLDAFFFSVETISTVGYGVMAPRSVPAHLVMTVESFVGIFNLAIATGLLFARISRPTARVMFSRQAVVTPHEGIPTLMFRAANRRRNRIVEAEVSVTLLHDVVTKEGATIRRFDTLATTRSRTPVFILSWQIMHPIDELSPLLGETAESLAARHAQIVVVVKGLDETFAQIIHARGAYEPHQIVWGAKLADMFSRDEDGTPLIDLSHFHEVA
jgi:inward rectifier potassium channel